MRWPSAWLTACSCAVAVAGCGGGGTRQTQPPPPRLPREFAQQLAVRSDRIARLLAAGNRCGATAEAATLQVQVTAAINAHRVPSRFLEPLSAASNDLVERVGACIRPPPSPEPREHKRKGKHRKKHGHGDGGDEG
jgi:hypothetical protein